MLDLRGELQALDRTSRVGTDAKLGYLVPWTSAEIVEQEAGLADLVYSQAALEHVMDLDNTYRAMSRLLKPGGVMSSQIDYKKHGTASAWNGHWGYSDLQWKLVFGRRRYFINRAPHSAHLRLMREAGLTPVLERHTRRYDGIGRRQLAPRFQDVPDSDMSCSDAYILAVKDAPSASD